MISTEEFEHIEKLSRIKIPKNLISAYIARLTGVVEYIGKLSLVDTTGITPTAQVTNLEHALREDIVEESMPQSDVLMNSKHVLNGYFKVPKVVE